jgi:undecaprenyl-diphosphatase
MPEWMQNTDNQTLTWLNDHAQQLDVLRRSADDISALGSWTVLGVFALFVLGLLLVEGRLRRLILFALLGAGTFFATDFVKHHFNRPRPVVEGMEPKKSPSFPSSHASLTMAAFLGGALALRGRKPDTSGNGYCILFGFLLSLVVGASRLCLRVHFLSDVVAGWLLGLALVLVFLIVDWLTGPSRTPEPVEEPPLARVEARKGRR